MNVKRAKAKTNHITSMTEASPTAEPPSSPRSLGALFEPVMVLQTRESAESLRRKPQISPSGASPVHGNSA